MDLDPNKSVASQQNQEEDELVDKGPPLKDDPKYQKYFKVRRHLSHGLVSTKRCSHRFSIYINEQMLKMVRSYVGWLSYATLSFSNFYFLHSIKGLPIGAVQNAMQRDSMDPSIMDLDPEKSVEYQKALASRKKAALKKKSTREPKKPKVRRKKIYWSPIEESKIDDNSLWSMIKGSVKFDSLKFDQDEFESLFTDSSNPADKKKAADDKSTASKQKKSVQVIDAKRGMNGGIILARLKIDFPTLAQMVDSM